MSGAPSSKSDAVRWRVLLGFAWCGLLALFAVTVFIFMGWVGVADAFLLPWSVGAAVLWPTTRRRSGIVPLHRSFSGRAILGAVLLLVALAAWGIDERPSGVPMQLIAVVYLAVPLLVTIATLALLVRGRRHARLSESAT